MPERIIVERTDGGISVICPAPNFTAEMCKKDIPADALQHAVVSTEHVNTDRVFRGAWVWDDSHPAKKRESVTKSKEICHDMRRAQREAEMKPLDIEATVPHLAADAEAKRAVIRAKHETMQIDIDASQTPEELKAILAREGL